MILLSYEVVVMLVRLVVFRFKVWRPLGEEGVKVVHPEEKTHDEVKAMGTCQETVTYC